MSTTSQPEVWLRGPLPGLSVYLQPIAHALLQAREEIEALMEPFPEHLLWKSPAGAASPGFHLQHITGVLRRLFAYAEGKSLTAEELDYLKLEGKPDSSITKANLLAALHKQVESALSMLQQWPEDQLTEPRSVGRAKLPSTVLGLLFHAAEHTMRHTGQLLVTVKVLTEKKATML
jgi:uncharacterized damage-inducible protein DinB